MGTRATYSIEGMTFYCHWDGYPTGAAARFVNMVEAMTVAKPVDDTGIYEVEERRGGWAYAFIRGNFDAEPAWNNSHDGHGDTQWRYDLAVDQRGVLGIQVQRRVGFTDEWKLDYSGEFGDWIALQRASKEPGPEVRAIVRTEIDAEHRVCYATVEAAVALAERCMKLGEHFREGNQNKARYFAKAKVWADAVATQQQGAAA